MKVGYIYIVTNKKHGTLYIGVTSNLIQRIYQHKNKIFEGFTEKYNLDKLVYYELFDDMENAIKREKRLKFWQRKWKIDLIEKQNPTWQDLYDSIL
mgnify:CR=1 FL=1